MTGTKIESAPVIGSRVTAQGFRGTVVEAETADMRRQLRLYPDRVWVRWDNAFSQCIAWAELEELDEDLDDEDEDDAPTPATGGDS